jgi:hypothetical protein
MAANIPVGTGLSAEMGGASRSPHAVAVRPGPRPMGRDEGESGWKPWGVTAGTSAGTSPPSTTHLAAALVFPAMTMTTSLSGESMSCRGVGYPETVRQLERRLSGHPLNRPHVQADLGAARAGHGPTVFDWLVGIFEAQIPGRLRLC